MIDVKKIKSKYKLKNTSQLILHYASLSKEIPSDFFEKYLKSSAIYRNNVINKNLDGCFIRQTTKLSNDIWLRGYQLNAKGNKRVLSELGDDYKKLFSDDGEDKYLRTTTKDINKRMRRQLYCYLYFLLDYNSVNYFYPHEKYYTNFYTLKEIKDMLINKQSDYFVIKNSALLGVVTTTDTTYLVYGANGDTYFFKRKLEQRMLGIARTLFSKPPEIILITPDESSKMKWAEQLLNYRRTDKESFLYNNYLTCDDARTHPLHLLSFVPQKNKYWGNASYIEGGSILYKRVQELVRNKYGFIPITKKITHGIYTDLNTKQENSICIFVYDFNVNRIHKTMNFIKYTKNPKVYLCCFKEQRSQIEQVFCKYLEQIQIIIIDDLIT